MIANDGQTRDENSRSGRPVDGCGASRAERVRMVRSHDGSSEKNANRSYRLTVFTMVVGGRVLPLLLAHVARMESRELFTLAHHRARDCHLGRRSLGVSMALGAFFAGLEVAIAWTQQFSSTSAPRLSRSTGNVNGWAPTCTLIADPQKAQQPPGTEAETRTRQEETLMPRATIFVLALIFAAPA